jgi:hypothetical protein
MFSSCCRCVSKKSIKQDDDDSEILKANDDKSVGDNSKQEFLDENIIKFTGIGYEEGQKVRIPLHKEVSIEKIDTFVASLDEKLTETIIDGEDDGFNESDENGEDTDSFKFSFILLFHSFEPLILNLYGFAQNHPLTILYFAS